VTHTYTIMKITRSAYDQIRTKLALAGYGHAIHDHGVEEVCDLSGIAVQAKGPPEDIQARAARLHDEVHEAAALVDAAEPMRTIGWAPEEAIPIIENALQEEQQLEHDAFGNAVIAWTQGYAGPDPTGFFEKFLFVLERRMVNELYELSPEQERQVAGLFEKMVAYHHGGDSAAHWVRGVLLALNEWRKCDDRI